MNAIEVSGITKSFGEVEALKGVDFNVQAGTVFGLLGPNGAGKTTTIRILTTIMRPDEGTARVLGKGPGGYSLHDVTLYPQRVRESIGLAGQYAAVDENLTGRENLRMMAALTHLPKAVRKGRADDLLELFGLQDASNRPVKTFSGGMRRRLDLAASLVHAPQVLFLDEPTTGLDPKSRQDLWNVIEELVDNGTTVLLTTQYLEEADYLADQLAIVDGGRIVAEGTPDGLKNEYGLKTLDAVFLLLTGKELE